jgi:hypothetical protein
MNQPLGAADFFALEAGETLDRLDGLVSRSDAPSGDDLLRASRVLRGAALMASQQPIARAAVIATVPDKAASRSTSACSFAKPFT